MTRRSSRILASLANATFTMAAASALMANAPSVRADAHSYASTKRQIKACVLVSNAATVTSGGVTYQENSAPYFFYMLDRRTDLKPAGWDFVNPLAASTVTGDIRQRWTTRDSSSTDTTLSDPSFAIGAPLTKNIGAYWEVNLDNITQSDLQQFDIVLMAYHTNAASFSPAEREKLRKYVDAGGTVWLEDLGGFDIKTNGDHTQDQFFIDAAFTGAAVNSGSLPSLGTLHHPMVNFPFPISTSSVQLLGQAGAANRHIAIDPVSGPLNPRILSPIIFSGSPANNLPLVSAGDYGAGHVIVSSAGIATGVSAYAGGASVAFENGNSGAVSGENTLNVQLVDAEFAINTIAWTSSVSTGAFNARRSGGSREDIGYGLGVRWSSVPVANTTIDSGSAIYKNCVFYVDGNSVMHCYDLSPGEDLDLDGNPDDGIVDYALGAPYDEVWRLDLKASGVSGWSSGSVRFGAPTVFSVNNGGVVLDEVAIQGSNGVTAVYNAFTRNGNGQLASSPSLLYTVVGAGGGTGGDFSPALVNQHGGQPFAGASPTLSDGVLFSLVYDSAIGTTTDTNNAWHINPVDPLTGQNIFGDNKLGTAPTPQSVLFQANLSVTVPILGMSMPVGSPMVGYVTDTTTGAQDKMVYVPTLTPDNNLNSGNGNGVWALFFSSKNDPLTDISGTSYASGLSINPNTVFRAFGNRGNIPWFAPSLPFNGMRTLLPKVHRTTNGVTIDLTYDPTGSSVNSFKVVSHLPAGVQNQHDTLVVVNPPINPGDTLTADYTVDWPAYSLPDLVSAANNQIVNRDMVNVFRVSRVINPFGNNVGTTPLYFTGSSALSPDDNIYVNVGDAPFADRIYAYHNHFLDTNATVAGGGKPEGPAVRWMFYPNGPVPDEGTYTGSQGLPARLINKDTFNGIFNAVPQMIVSDLESIGTPAYSNGVVYQTGWAHMQYGTGGAVNEWDATVVIAYKSTPSLTFIPKQSDGTPIVMQDSSLQQANGQRTRPVTIEQLDILHYVPGQAAKTIVLTEGSNFTVDYSSSTISIFNCQQGTSGDSFNLAAPFVIKQGGQVLGGLQYNANGYGLLDNVLWWMIVPIQRKKSGTVDPNAPIVPGLLDVQPASGPTVIGNTLYYGTQHGSLAAIDLSNMPSDGSQATLYRSDGTLRLRTAPVQWDTILNTAVDQPITNPPVGTTDVVVATGPKGLTAFDNQLTLVADNNRLIEVNHAGEAVWSMDATQTQTVVGGALGANGNIASAKISLARPAKAAYSSLNNYLIADTGNSRIAMTDKGGVVIWELHSFFDGMHFLRPGDPFTLNSPMDVQAYTLIGNGPISFTSPLTGATFSYTGYYYSYHYLIADSGNNRIVEIVDIFDANGNPIVMTASGQASVTMLHQLMYVSTTTSEQSKSYRYRTVNQFTVPTGPATSQQYIVSSLDTTAQGGGDPGFTATTSLPVDSSGSSIVLLKRGTGAADGAVFARYTGLFNPKTGSHVPLKGVTYVSEVTTYDASGNTQLRLLVCDANGVYEATTPEQYPAAGVKSGEIIIMWALYSVEYQAMTGRPLQAASIQRLGASDYYAATNLFYPHYLITNRYTGSDNVVAMFGGGLPLLNAVSSQVRGEVVEVRGDVYYNSAAYPQGYFSGAAKLYTNVGQMLAPNSVTSAIVWMTPKETISAVPNLVPIKRVIGSGTSGGTSTYILEQPTFSQRAN
jgi:hypothetical protein